MGQLLNFIGLLLLVSLVDGLDGTQVQAASSRSDSRPIVQGNKYPIPSTNNNKMYAASWNQVRPLQYMPMKPMVATRAPAPAMVKNQSAVRGGQQQHLSRDPPANIYTGSPKKKIRRRHKPKQAVVVASTTIPTVQAKNYMKPANATAPASLLRPTYKSKPRAIEENELQVAGPSRVSAGHFNDHPFGDGSRFTGGGGMVHFGGDDFRRPNRLPPPPPLGFFGGRESHLGNNMMFRNRDNPMMDNNHVRTFAPTPFRGLLGSLGRFSRGLFGRSLGRSANEPAFSVGKSPPPAAMETTARSSTDRKQLSNQSGQKLSAKHGYYANEYNTIDKPSGPIVVEQIPTETALRNNEVEFENPQKSSFKDKYRGHKQNLAISPTNSYQRKANEILTAW